MRNANNEQQITKKYSDNSNELDIQPPNCSQKVDQSTVIANTNNNINKQNITMDKGYYLQGLKVKNNNLKCMPSNKQLNITYTQGLNARYENKSQTIPSQKSKTQILSQQQQLNPFQSQPTTPKYKLIFINRPRGDSLSAQQEEISLDDISLKTGYSKDLGSSNYNQMKIISKTHKTQELQNGINFNPKKQFAAVDLNNIDLPCSSSFNNEVEDEKEQLDISILQNHNKKEIQINNQKCRKTNKRISIEKNYEDYNQKKIAEDSCILKNLVTKEQKMANSQQLIESMKNILLLGDLSEPQTENTQEDTHRGMLTSISQQFLDDFIPEEPDIAENMAVLKKVRINIPSARLNFNSDPKLYQKEFKYYLTSLMRAINNPQFQDNITNLYREHFVQSYQALQYAKMQIIPKKFENFKTKITLPKLNTNKKTLIFDLDETLIHCNDSLDVQGDAIIGITLKPGEQIKASINIRPHVKECLQELINYFEIIVFTASQSIYANAVIDFLDPDKKLINYRMYREQCMCLNSMYIKDLRIFQTRELKNIILVDNSCFSFCNNIQNGIPIIPYYNDKSDQELKYLTEFLKTLHDVDDVRPIIQAAFKLEQYTNYNNPTLLIKSLFADYLDQQIYQYLTK